jgi:hypothetical protein
MQGFLEHIRGLAAAGSEWEAAMARRGVLDEMALNIRWVEHNATAL